MSCSTNQAFIEYQRQIKEHPKKARNISTAR